MNRKLRAKRILRILKEHYPDAKISLNYSNNFELLVAVILSAQTTDKQVNKVTPALFKKYNSVKKFANADIKKLEKNLTSIGLFRTKARNIKSSAKIILNKFNGKVPDSMDELLTLPGVGRKTANVVLSAGFNKNYGIAVDTHVKRLAFGFGLTKEKNPDKIERDLMDLYDKDDWEKVTRLFITHGRKKDKKVSLLLGKI